MKAFILAGGFGIRLREVLHGRPKVLAPVQGRPFLEHVIRQLKQQGIDQMVLGVGYLASYIRDAFGDGAHLGVTIQYAEEPRPLGTAGAIKNGAHLLKDDFLVLNGDTYFDLDVQALAAFHRDRAADVTIAVTPTYHGRGGLIELDRHGRVVRFEEESDGHQRQGKGKRKRKAYSNAGVYLFNPKMLKLIRPHERSSLERDLFPVLLDQGASVYGFVASGEYIDIGTPESYEAAIELLKGRP